MGDICGGERVLYENLSKVTKQGNLFKTRARLSLAKKDGLPQ